MKLPEPKELHLWLARLDGGLDIGPALALLTQEEMTRAERFQFEIHRRRFIEARAALRCILSLYLSILPHDIPLMATPNGKLYIEHSHLFFNLSHSENLAIYGFTFNNEVGVDIEKIRASYNDKLAQRYFSTEEYAEFSKLPEEQKTADFYRIWTGKEAVIKALGEKISFSLPSFTIPADKNKEEVLIPKHKLAKVYLQNAELVVGFQASFATAEPVLKVRLINYEREGYSKPSQRMD